MINRLSSWFKKNKFSFKDTIILFENLYVVDVNYYEYSNHITPKQKETYEMFLKEKKHICFEIEKTVLCYYNNTILNDRVEYDYIDSSVELAKVVNDLAKTVKPISIEIYDYSADYTMSLIFELEWDNERGIGVFLKNNNVEIVGSQSEVIK